MQLDLMKEVHRMDENVLRLTIEACELELSRRRASLSAVTPAAGTAPGSATNGMHVFKSGAKRSELCPRYDLIPASFLRRLGNRFTGKTLSDGRPDGGALKYGEGNWEKGLPTSDIINHGLHHFQRLANTFRKALTEVANTHEGSWAGRMAYVRSRVAAELEVDDDLGGAAWALAALSEQLETGFKHDERFEQELEGVRSIDAAKQKASVPGAGGDGYPIGHAAPSA